MVQKLTETKNRTMRIINKIKSISIFIIITSVILCTTAFLPSQNINNQDNNNKYGIIHQPYLPDSMSFCEEKVPLKYFDVKESLDRELISNEYWQSNTILLIKRANRFFPIIDSILKKNNIPSDFKYLAAIESGLINVTSPVGAKGYWQFMENTAKEYGLEISNDVDERQNIEKSTEAACKYFHKAYERFKNWTLVAASYNMGINGVAKNCDQQHVNSYYDLKLNIETSRYVFRILAIKLILENPEKYYYDIDKKYYYKPFVFCTELVDSTITDLTTFAEIHNTNVKILKTLNPWLISNSLKNPKHKIYEIKIPTENARLNNFGE